ncbi:MAG: AbrB/MazE/SpoVT family DNA-binding domain-containing protein [Crenarchaeota archaeon]|nr:AbrB/MazE/SpoVT family DNA-binding domain-containing protein [Thermoproteota archaeon]
MEIVKVTRNYQVTIPASVRKAAGIKEGDKVKVVFDEEEGVVKIIPLKKKRITVKLGKPLSPEDIESLVEEALDEGSP